MIRRTRWFLAAGLLISLLVAGGVSSLASSSPDGLESVTQAGCRYADGDVTGRCIADRAGGHEVGGPLADYGVAGVDDPYLSTGLAGALGVLVVFVLGAAVTRLMRGRDPGRNDPR